MAAGVTPEEREAGGGTMEQLLAALQTLTEGQRRMEEEMVSLNNGQQALLEGMGLRSEPARRRARPSKWQASTEGPPAAVPEMHLLAMSESSERTGADSHGRAAAESSLLETEESAEQQEPEGEERMSRVKSSRRSCGRFASLHVMEAEQSLGRCSEELEPRQDMYRGTRRSNMAQSYGLPAAWPTDLPIRKEIEGESGHVEAMLDSSSSDLQSMLHHTASWTSSALFSVGEVRQRRMRFVLEPSSSIRTFLDVCNLLTLLYDMTATPYALAWEAPFEGAIKYGTYTTLVVWMLDIFLNFRTGFYRFGELEMRPKAIASRYMRTWFFPDLCFVTTDLVNIVLTSMDHGGGSAEGIRALRVAKAGRALRIVGVLRMARLFEKLSRIWDRHAPLGDASSFALEVTLILFTILWLNHVVSCVWYALGRGAPSDTGVSWLSVPISAQDERTYGDSGFWYQYLTAFHWSVTQMTPGSMQVSPVNSFERQFNIICLIFGMIVFSTLVSSLSSKMMRVKMEMQEHDRKLNVLRRFLRSSAVSPQLAVDVQKQAAERLRASRRPLTMKEVQAVSLLSLSMRSELQLELCRNSLLRHPLFRVIEYLDGFVTRKICLEAVDFTVLSKGDTLFQAGAAAPGAYVVSSGTLRYSQDPTSSNVPTEVHQIVQQGSWLCEAALWSSWAHVGTAEATSVCELCSLGAEKFARTLKGRCLAQEVAWEYAKAFHSRLITSTPPNVNWPNDVEIPHAGFHELITSLAGPMRVIVGLAAVEALKASSSSTGTLGWGIMAQSTLDVSYLEQEVRKGTSVLMVSERGEVVRVVAVSALQLSCPAEDGRILVQLGKWEAGHLTFNCTLPGCKVREGDHPARALQRLLEGRIVQFAGGITMERVETSVECKNSAAYGVKTKYLRTLHIATLSPDFQMPELLVLGKTPRPALGRKRVGPPLPRREVFLLTDDGSVGYLHTWLTLEEYGHFTGPGGHSMLDSWLAPVHFEVTDEALAATAAAAGGLCETIQLAVQRQHRRSI